MPLRLLLLLALTLVAVPGCSANESRPTATPPQPAFELPSSSGDQVAVLATAISEGWFRFALQSRSAGGDTFYVVRPPVSEEVMDALSRSPKLPPHEVVWVDALDEIPHRTAERTFTDGYAVSVMQAARVGADTVELDISYHYGVDDSNPSTVRIARTDGGWAVQRPNPAAGP